MLENPIATDHLDSVVKIPPVTRSRKEKSARMSQIRRPHPFGHQVIHRSLDHRRYRLIS
jgi:hypothetical protein